MAHPPPHRKTNPVFCVMIILSLRMDFCYFLPPHAFLYSDSRPRSSPCYHVDLSILLRFAHPSLTARLPSQDDMYLNHTPFEEFGCIYNSSCHIFALLENASLPS